MENFDLAMIEYSRPGCRFHPKILERPIIEPGGLCRGPFIEPWAPLAKSTTL